VYIGSTTRPLSERIGEHRNDFKGNRGRSPGDVLKFGDAYIELIEACPCNNKEELHKREGEVIRATENTVNRSVAGRTKKQSMKNWYKINKDKRKQYRTTKIRCECGVSVSRGGILIHKRSKKHRNEMLILELADEL